MAKRINWKPKAARQYRELIDYLKEEFSEATAEKFVEKVTAKLSQIERYPEIGHVTRYKTVRRVKVGKYNSFYYRIAGSPIIILFVWNAKQDPGKNPYQ